MRASDVRSAIITVVEAATVDTQAGPRDKFVHVDTGGRELEAAPDRVFRCVLTQPPRRTAVFTLDAYEVEYTVDIHYALGKQVEDRIAQDAEQVVFDLTSLNAQHQDLMNSSVQSGSVFDLDQLLVCRIPVLCTYRLTGVS